MPKKIPKKRTQKSPPPNLLIPIITISILATLAIALLLARPKPVPIGINEVAGATSNCSQLAFTDNFSGTTLDTSKWGTYGAADNITTIDNQLSFSIPTTGAVEISSGGKIEIEGDFVQEITLSSLTTAPIEKQNASFFLGIVSDDWKNWYRIEIFKNGNIRTNSTTDTVTTTLGVIKDYNNNPTKLKMVREGSTLKTFYDLGAGYILHSIVPNIYTGKVFIQLLAQSHAPENPQVTVMANKYSLSCRIEAPANLKPLSGLIDPGVQNISWDKVDGATGYLLRIDEVSQGSTLGACADKKGQYDACETLSANSYNFNFVAGKKYHIWVHAYLGNVNIYSNPISVDISTSLPSTALNLKANCTPDGKSVLLSWDGVVGVESYKVRLDDKAGRVTNFDNIKQLQYITSVTPGKMYSFWVHSHKDGQDSNQSTAVDFTCNATSTPTPTPKPTVKPTAKPTVTPTVAPTPTPTTQAYVIASPKASAFAYENTDTDTSTDTTATKSTNPLSRFFTWIASLFE